MFPSNKKNEEELPTKEKWDFDIKKLNEDAERIRELDKEEKKCVCTP